MNSKEKFNEKLSQIALGLIFYTILVILWGAWVRISHSGDGCGDTWPLCQGQIIPQAAMKKTWVEYSHRFTSGLYGIIVVILYFWIKKRKDIRSSIPKWSFWVLIFMITEALLGAKLVIFRLVNLNDSVWRLIVMSLHQLNSFLLVAFSVRLYCASKEDSFLALFDNESREIKKVSEVLSIKKLFGSPVPLFLILILAMTGAWAALSTTLFPSVSLFKGLMEDFANDSHYLLKIRITHPVLGILFGSLMALLFYKKSLDYEESQSRGPLIKLLQRLSLITSLAITSGVVIGILTLVTLSPLPLKMIHLAIAHILWCFFIAYYHFSSFAKSLDK
ncbi:MAG: COX15/CtaA family protein [Bdellovibrionales bacterium]|nr:COX15/CtaA family protein [Bdellovibrionales bacterium]